MTPLEQAILAARFNNVPLDEIIAKVQGWINGDNIEGVTEATRFAIKRQLAGIETHQVAAFADLLLSRFERAVIVDAAQEFNPEVLFTYFGPLDGATRGICVDALTDIRNDTGFTIDEISGLAVGLIDGGGHHCRHTFRPAI